MLAVIFFSITRTEPLASFQEYKGLDLKKNGTQGKPKTKKSGLKVVTLIATLNPVSQVLW